MACFVAPVTAGMITAACRKRIPERYHVNWLNYMFLGASVGLVMDHAAGGEIVPFFPFLTAMATAQGASAALGEIATVGTAIVLACIAVWAVAVKASWVMERRSSSGQKA